MRNSLLRSNFKKQLMQNSLFMQNHLVRSLFKKQLIYAKQVITIYFFLFFYKTTSYNLFFKNHLFMQNNLFMTISFLKEQLIQNCLFM